MQKASKPLCGLIVLYQLFPLPSTNTSPACGESPQTIRDENGRSSGGGSPLDNESANEYFTLCADDMTASQCVTALVSHPGLKLTR